MKLDKSKLPSVEEMDPLLAEKAVQGKSAAPAPSPLDLLMLSRLKAQFPNATPGELQQMIDRM